MDVDVNVTASAAAAAAVVGIDMDVIFSRRAEGNITTGIEFRKRSSLRCNCDPGTRVGASGRRKLIGDRAGKAAVSASAGSLAS
jgi:hypothetical protein